MGVKVYISSISGSQKIKKNQQSVLMVLGGKGIAFEEIDISVDEEAKKLMLEKGKARDGNPPLPPQIFNNDQYCGDYDDFDEANELKTLQDFLKLSSGDN